MPSLPLYVIITPARNESQYIERTLQSVVAQTCLPAKWVIIDDGSTDNTSEIVRRYAADHPWIEIIAMPERTERNFAGKVNAFKAGYEMVKPLDPQVIVNLDADLEIVPDHFEFLLRQ